MRELAELVVEITGSTSPIIAVPLPDEREGDPLQRCPDIALLSTTYGWAPEVSLREGLARMVSWFTTKEDLT